MHIAGGDEPDADPLAPLTHLDVDALMTRLGLAIDARAVEDAGLDGAAAAFGTAAGTTRESARGPGGAEGVDATRSLDARPLHGCADAAIAEDEADSSEVAQIVERAAAARAAVTRKPTTHDGRHTTTPSVFKRGVLPTRRVDRCMQQLQQLRRLPRGQPLEHDTVTVVMVV